MAEQQATPSTHTCISRVLWHLHFSATSISGGSPFATSSFVKEYDQRLSHLIALPPVSTKQGQCNIPFICEPHYCRHHIFERRNSLASLPRLLARVKVLESTRLHHRRAGAISIGRTIALRQEPSSPKDFLSVSQTCTEVPYRRSLQANANP